MTSYTCTDVQKNNLYRNSSFGERISNIIEERGVSKAWIAEKLGISKQALNYLLKHSLAPKFVDEFAELLNLNPCWIEMGFGEPFPSSVETDQTVKMPVLTNAEILNHIAGHIEGRQYIDLSKKSAGSALVYQLNDNSNFPPFIPGSILIFDIKRQPVHGDYVLLIIDHDVFVRQYVLDGKNVCYKASNIEHKTYINVDAQLIGVLLEARYQIN